MKEVIAVLVLLGLFGCSSNSKKSKIDYQATNKVVLKSVAQDMEKISNPLRKIASVKGIGREIGVDIRKLKKGVSFQMLVFPKINTMHMKIRDDKPIDYRKPETFNFKVLESGMCNILQSKDKTKIFRGFGSNSVERCMIIEVKKQRPKAWGRMVLSSHIGRGQVLKIRTYFDEDFRPYGQSLDIARKAGVEKFETVNIKNNPNNHSSSGLYMFPIDVPNLLHPRENFKLVAKNNVKYPNNFFVTSKIKTMIKRKKCTSGYQLKFSGIYREMRNVYWCRDNFWPTTIETQKFFAILK